MEADLKDLNETIEQQPSNAHYFNYRGIARYHLNDINGALIDLKKAADLGDAKGKHNYAKLLDKTKNNDIV